MIVRTIQGATSTAAASTDHTLLGPTPAFHVTDPHWGPGDGAGRATRCWAMPRPEHLGLSTPSSKKGHCTMTGQGQRSRRQSSPLSGGGGTSVAIMPSSLADVHLATHLPQVLSSALPYLLLLEPHSWNHLFLFLCSGAWRKKVLTETANSYESKLSKLWFSVKIFLSAHFHTQCWRLHLLDKTSAS